MTFAKISSETDYPLMKIDYWSMTFAKISSENDYPSMKIVYRSMLLPDAPVGAPSSNKMFPA